MLGKQKTTLIRYHYDGLSRIADHRLPDEPVARHFYCEERPVTVEQQSIVRFGEQLLAQQQRKDDKFESTLLITDMQRSVLNAPQVSHRKTLSYAPYGYHSAQGSVAGFLGFAGQRPDPVTGHYLLGNGYRTFNPVLMRFNSPDRLSPFHRGGLNAYAYCLGDPINQYDPSGKFSVAVANLSSKITTGFVSWIKHAPVKSVKNVKRISKGVTVFDDVKKGKRRLNFQMHGTPDGRAGWGGREYIDANEFYERASKSVQFEKYDEIRLVMCYSGTDMTRSPLGPGMGSFAARISAGTGLPVKGYQGGVYSTWGLNGFMNVGDVVKSRYFAVIKSNEQLKYSSYTLGYKYRPVTIDFDGVLFNRYRSEIRD